MCVRMCTCDMFSVRCAVGAAIIELCLCIVMVVYDVCVANIMIVRVENMRGVNCSVVDM